MEFHNTFTVAAPLDTVWKFMQNAQEVAPCVPGAAITDSVDNTHYKGTVKIKLGAVQMNYRGDLEMAPDEARHTMVLKAKGTEARGSGGASGTFTAVLHEEAEGTSVDINSTVDVTGRVAQFGRGIMQDVGTRMVNQFADCLEQKLQPSASNNQESQSTAQSAGEDTQQVVASTADRPSNGKATTPAASNTPHATVETRPTLSEPPIATPPSRQPASESPANEIRVGQLLLEMTRSRIAAALRALAERLEPR